MSERVERRTAESASRAWTLATSAPAGRISAMVTGGGGCSLNCGSWRLRCTLMLTTAVLDLAGSPPSTANTRI